MKTERRTITLGAAVIAIVANFLAGAYVASRYRVPPADTFAVSDAAAAPEAVPAPKATPKAEDLVQAISEVMRSKTS